MNDFPRKQAFTLVELLVVIAIIGILMGLLLPAVQALRESSRRMNCSNRLAQIGVALHEYHLSAEHFPAGTVDSATVIRNAPKGYHHNWIGTILPYLDLKVVYDNIDQDVSIYDKKNQPVRQTPLTAVRCPSSANDVATTSSSYAGIHSPIETPIRETNDGVFFLNQGVTAEDMVDGINYTLFVGEKMSRSEEDLGWASGTRSSLRNVGHKFGTTYSLNKPSERNQVKEPELWVGGLASAHPSGLHLLMGSGAVRFFGDTGDMRLLKQLAHRSDGGLETFGAPAIDPVDSFEPASPRVEAKTSIEPKEEPPASNEPKGEEQ